MPECSRVGCQNEVLVHELPAPPWPPVCADCQRAEQMPSVPSDRPPRKPNA